MEERWKGGGREERWKRREEGRKGGVRGRNGICLVFFSLFVCLLNFLFYFKSNIFTGE